MNDQPPTGQGRPARLSEDRLNAIIASLAVNCMLDEDEGRDLLVEIAALRSERDAAREESAYLTRCLYDEGVRADHEHRQHETASAWAQESLMAARAAGAERDAWKARAERLISDAADIQRYWQDEGVRGDGFCFSLNCLLRDAGLEEPLQALAEPQPPCPGYVPTGHVCERCGEAPSEHSRARGLDGEGAE
jgi:hypothetical protein